MTANVADLKAKYGSSIGPFLSPLASDWETLMFKVIDSLHNASNEGLTNSESICSRLNGMVIAGSVNASELDDIIDELREVHTNSNDSALTQISKEAIEILFSIRFDKNIIDK